MAPRVPTVSGENHRQSEPVYPPRDSLVRPLTDEEIERLQRRLGKPVDRNFLVGWVSQSIHDVVRLSTQRVQPNARECRDGLRKTAKEGRRWLKQVDTCPSISLLGPELDEFKQIIAGFCNQADLLANKFTVKRGNPRTSFFVRVFIGRMVGIAKTASVYPRSESRASRSQTAPRRPPDFFYFVDEALAIAEDVIKSSDLTDDRKQAALSMLTVKSRGALSKLVEQARGKISDYREGPHGGLVTWPMTDSQ
jgi:hypothetical protein